MGWILPVLIGGFLNSMKSFADAVVTVLHQTNPMNAIPLARQALILKPLKRATYDEEWAVLREVIDLAASKHGGIYLAEEPEYSLRSPHAPQPLPRGLRLRSAITSLLCANRPLLVSELAERYAAAYGDSAKSPLFQMYWHLEQPQFEGPEYIIRTRDFLIGLEPISSPLAISTQVKPVTPAKPQALSISSRIDERSVELLLANNLALLEPGLVLIKRQCTLGSVGRADLICRDQQGDIVVVEIKRPSARYREVIGQITSYMGWIKRNMAQPGERTRGIIVIGTADEKLNFAIEALQDISVVPFV
jgi:hypothetical protein